MKSAKYNFRREENRGNAVYKLVMYACSGSGIVGTYTNSKGIKVIVIYGYYNKPDFGLQMLRNMAIRYKHQITMAVIYAKPNLNQNHSDFSEIIEKFTTQ